MRQIQTPVLIPVVELEPATFATEDRRRPPGSAAEAPRAWDDYWRACLEDAGLSTPEPIAPGSWCVATADLAGADLVIVLGHALAELGIAGDLEERIAALAGGLAIADGPEVIRAPGCCEDLEDLDAWEQIREDAAASWRIAAIGHGELGVRRVVDDLEVRERDSLALAIAAPAFDEALERAQAARVAFRDEIRRTLDAIESVCRYPPERLERLADLLAGLR